MDRGAEATFMAAISSLVGGMVRSLKDVDLTLPQYRVLVLVEELGVQTMAQLAGRLEVNPSTVTRACDRLEKRGLLVRRPHADDGRSVYAELTPKGRELVDGVMEQRRGAIRSVLRATAPHRQRELAEAVRQMLDVPGGAAIEADALADAGASTPRGRAR